MGMNYWLMKSEPDVYSIADLERDRRTLWDGIRNYQARNFLRSMALGDRAFFYHSNTNPPGIVGVMRIVESDVADHTQFDRKSKYFDPKSSPDAPRWWTVVVEYVETWPQPIPLAILRQTFTPEDLLVVRPGNRLSVIPVPEATAQKILMMGRGGVRLED